MISFDEYYRKYLGLKQDKSEHEIINSTERRSRPVAFFYLHHLISTVIDGELTHSLSPRLVQEFTRNIGNHPGGKIDPELVRTIDDAMFSTLPPLSYSPMQMHRMTTESIDLIPLRENFTVTALSEDSKSLFDNQTSQRGIQFSRYCWKARLKAIQDGRYFAIIENDEIVSSSYISDIDHGGGNIVVGTKPKYRKKGYAKAVVAQATEWCLENGVRPIYLVDVRNLPSIKLAEGLGYRTMAEEVVVSSYIGINVYRQDEPDACQRMG